MPEVNETWKDIPGYEGAYQVSDMGRVRSLTRQVRTVDRAGVERTRRVRGVILRPSRNRGYPFVVLCLNGESRVVYVHRVVAVAFVENPGARLEVNHVDGKHANNHVSNLEWATRAENHRHAIDMLGAGKKAVVGLKADGTIIHFDSIKAAAEHVNVSGTAIGHAVAGRRKTIAGYAWSYA